MSMEVPGERFRRIGYTNTTKRKTGRARAMRVAPRSTEDDLSGRHRGIDDVYFLGDGVRPPNSAHESGQIFAVFGKKYPERAWLRHPCAIVELRVDDGIGPQLSRPQQAAHF